ncbi:siderophore-interacting protein [Demequina capsici]|uniref:Siderophore-interacting protein n=1 Tax=Demequina capsici TaxID=3075620 RepID=A0AA96JDD0_9MICO|nr:siderophore-interacting protein [Demequina sp. OYTSA14]WNM24629.1 siderophore-interacting protein [Demequina sp. OYTSA14]
METTITTVVTGVEPVTPGFVRVRVTTPGDSWRSTGAADEFVHVDVGEADADASDGHASRHYTISKVLSDGFEMEIAVHGEGPGAAWGERVRPGDAVAVSEPKAYYAPPSSAHRRVLLGDATALPAIARILAEANPDERFTVVIELATIADSRELPSAAAVDLEWRLGGNGIGPSVLRSALADLLPRLRDADAEPYLWVACEAAESRRIRQFARHEAQLPMTVLRIVGYWHGDHERVVRAWANLTEAQRERAAEIWREDRTDEENWVDYEPFLRSLGV